MCDGSYTLCAARGKSIPSISQSVGVRCRSEKSPSFGLCQVDMYATMNFIFFTISNLNYAVFVSLAHISALQSGFGGPKYGMAKRYRKEEWWLITRVAFTLNSSRDTVT